ncbi:ATP-binding protein [Mariniblastus sp.]|nr:ATP-binding protein [Mariniblastus sp.]
MSDKKNLQLTQRELELLRATVASIGDAVIATDASGRIALLNAGAEKLTGWSSNDAAGKPLDTVYRIASVKTGELLIGLAEKVLRNDADVDLGEEVSLVARDGTEHLVEGRASAIRLPDQQIVGCVLIVRDVIGRSKEASLISEQNSLLELVVRGGPAKEVLDHVCLAVERHVAGDVVATVLLADKSGKNLRPAAGPHCPEAYADAVNPVKIGAGCGSCGTAAFLREPVIVSDIATDPLWKDFRQAALPYNLRSCWSVPILHSGGSVLGTFAVYSRTVRKPNDQELRVMEFLGRTAGIAIERQRAEEALRQSEQRALQASKAKSEFLANMSHEIRTPMSAILGHADLLLTYLKDPDNIACVGTIRRNGDHLLNIINDILDISRIEAGKMDIAKSRCPLIGIISDLWTMMHVKVSDKPVELRFVAEDPLPEMIKTDPQRLKQIFINLLGNAVKFTQSGHVTLRVSVINVDNPSTLRFDVEDSGIGIPEENLENLFDSFSQGDASVTRQFGGSGLGLAISKRLTGMLGGQLTAQSIEGVGSTFSLTLPCGSFDGNRMISINANDLVTEFEPVELTANLPCRVLLVDDRRDVRFLAQQILEKAGATVTLAEDGLEAIETVSNADENNERIDVIVMDMQMPNMDGYSATANLRSFGCVLPVIALTANAMSGDREQCLTAGCDDYLSKPIDASALLEKVRRLTQDISTEELTDQRARRIAELRSN